MSFHAAKAEKSARLQRVLAVLKEGGAIGVTSRELMTKADVVAPGTCVSELRKNGYAITCRLLNTLGDGTRIYLYQYKGNRTTEAIEFRTNAATTSWYRTDL